MAWANLVLPENQLADMLAECQPARGVLTYPGYAWSDLAAVMDAGTIPEGDTAERIKTGRLAELADDPDYIARPRIGVADIETDTLTRTGVTGFDLSGRLFVVIELDVPAGLNESQAKTDIRRKAKAIEHALLSLPLEAPRLELMRIATESGLVYPQANNGEWFGVIQYDVTYRGYAGFD